MEANSGPFQVDQTALVIGLRGGNWSVETDARAFFR